MTRKEVNMQAWTKLVHLENCVQPRPSKKEREKWMKKTTRMLYCFHRSHVSIACVLGSLSKTTWS